MQCALHLHGLKSAHKIRWIGTKSDLSSLPSPAELPLTPLTTL